MRNNQLTSMMRIGAKVMLFGGFCFITACSQEEIAVNPVNSSFDRQIKTLAGTRVWTGDPNQPWQDVFENFNTEDNGGTTPTLTSITDATYGKAWRVIKPAGAKRAEMSRAKGYNQQEGETIDLNYKFKINPQTDIGSSEITVFQWKTDGNVDRQNYPFNLTYKNGKLYLNLFGPGTPDWTSGSVSGRKNTVWSGTAAAGQWLSIGFRIKVSRYIGTDNSKKGYIQLWYNGSAQTFTTQNSTSNYDVTLTNNNKRVLHRTNDGSVTYPKWGVYNEASRPFEIRTLFANMTIDKL
ncbi:hypothetical protein I5M32_11580 [Pedobacter sp. SD-b]|uniref:Polysaccharide lyase n=1 Tax=Pedobacter segetis TaxID=2793069 RepID=A0ABS1BL20_9SPHI|nr:heparin lyase I family protein [Pedobacter segetis]MBK0383598.1 hypothetical protein [Pedobacter segetis]